MEEAGKLIAAELGQCYYFQALQIGLHGSVWLGPCGGKGCWTRWSHIGLLVCSPMHLNILVRRWDLKGASIDLSKVNRRALGKVKTAVLLETEVERKVISISELCCNKRSYNYLKGCVSE